jgi:hypothetical protein
MQERVAGIVPDSGWQRFRPAVPELDDLCPALRGEKPDFFARAGVSPATSDQLKIGQTVLHVQFDICSARRDTGVVTRIDDLGVTVEFKGGSEMHSFNHDGIHFNGRQQGCLCLPDSENPTA